MKAAPLKRHVRSFGALDGSSPCMHSPHPLCLGRYSRLEASYTTQATSSYTVTTAALTAAQQLTSHALQAAGFLAT